ncbi:MAG: DEAD/DEAH box helicase [Spirochaetota bacterium]
MKFTDQGLSPEIIRAITDLGFTEPMPIQKKALPILLNDPVDLLAIAQTGTGKTAAYALPMIQLIDTDSKETQGIILTPTRELCVQVSKDIEKFAKYIDGFRTLAVYGGANMEQQIRALRKGVHLIVGTPGRVHDLIRKSHINISGIQTLTLDEADEMLSMGFKEELDAILATTPKSRQTLLFSATMPADILRISKSYMKDPVQIQAGKPNTSSDNIQHTYYMVKHSNKYMALKRIADVNPNIYGIVFCRTREETKEVARQLLSDGYLVDALHGDISQPQREVVLNNFRNRSLNFLVATDVAARGIDVQDITHVINFTLPDDTETYIHRCGRTGRAGKKGLSIVLATNREMNKIRRIEKATRKEFTFSTLPSNREICKQQLFHRLEQVEKAEVAEDVLEPFLEEIYERFADMDKEAVIKLFISAEFQKFFSYYQNHKDKNLSESPFPEINKKKKKRKKDGFGGDKRQFWSKPKERRRKIKRKSTARK